jgi:F-type H+-transporting ATPase subunit b
MHNILNKWRHFEFLVRDFSFGRSLLHTTSAVSTKPAGKPDDYFDPWENPERDYVNFPTRRQLQTNLPVRHVIIPESFFKAFHAKTGVTGPYAFLTGLTTFLVSKEIWVLEHEFLAGIEFYIVIAMIIKYVGKPIIAPMVDKAGQEDDAALAKIRQDEIDKYKVSIDGEKEAQVMASSYEELIQAKKDAVGLQLEAEYRSRLANAYTQVKYFKRKCFMPFLYSLMKLFRTYITNFSKEILDTDNLITRIKVL